MIFFERSLVNYTGFLDLTAVAPCIGFCILSLTKMLTVSLNAKKLSKMYTELQEMFPKCEENRIVNESESMSRTSHNV